MSAKDRKTLVLSLKYKNW